MAKKKIVGILTIVCILLTGCSLGRGEAITIDVWHAYNGEMAEIFEELVAEFNETVGKDKNIIVTTKGMGSIEKSRDAYKASLEETVGSEEIPNIFPGYSDTVEEFAKDGKLCNCINYLTDTELNDYLPINVSQYKDELYIYPITMATEVLVINQAIWKPFAEKNNLSLEDLSTWEGLCHVGEMFFNYSNGKAFFGRDSIANYMFVGSKQLGQEIITEAEGNAKINLDENVLKKLWDNYYVPYVKGYYTSIGKFRSDDAKTEDIIAFVASSGGSAFFPETIVKEDGSTYESNLLVLPPPNFDGTKEMTVLQGAGMAISKKDEIENKASIEFMKWITSPKQNWEMSIVSGYIPVEGKSYEKEYTDKMDSLTNNRLNNTEYETVKTCIKVINKYEPYIGDDYDREYQYRMIINNSLENMAKKDRNNKIATDEMTSNERFKQWINELEEDLGNVQKK